jgi:hypothetical protein
MYINMAVVLLHTTQIRHYTNSLNMAEAYIIMAFYQQKHSMYK